MSGRVNKLQQKYPDAYVWSFGDSPQLAGELVALVKQGIKRATCCSYASYKLDETPVIPGALHIVLDGAGAPACVIRTMSLRLIRFNEMTPELAALEGEGDKSLAYWREGHKAFFTREGTFSPDMELIFEEFTVIETCT